MNVTTNTRLRRKRRVSRAIRGTAARPRISVHRTNRYLYAQAIDDQSQKTLASITLPNKKSLSVENSSELGVAFAKKLTDASISIAVYDRGAFAYKGNVKAFAEALRENGITI